MQTPTLETLAQLAAVMASLTEKPASTARRAFQLWQACGEEIARMGPHIETLSRAIEAAAAGRAENRTFVAGFKPGESVPLDDFLKACMPNSKPGDRMAKWRAYTAHGLAADDRRQGLPAKSPAALAEAVGDALRGERENGIPANNLTDYRYCFMLYLASDRAQQNTERGIKAAMAKKIIRNSKTARKRPQVRKSKP
jgi:hypothetical protein